MKLYCAGKITGLDYEEAESLFMHAETAIEKAGHTPLNPLKLVEQTGVCICGYELSFVKFGSFGVDGGGCTAECKENRDRDREWVDYMLDAIAVVMVMAEGIYMLPNWRDSLGARIEHAIAAELKMPIYYAASELPIGSDWPEANAEAA